ncbi:hypothetical protein GCK72_001748 [Caenorhabditis remanei]|uniref:Uncharacterized protein n=1 Tax=Caenorhabditis remanei TaxID=31234 RepID=A0A6A5HRM6_CAERE|nr:hypothetical protein GCK72_001748 [Caenorhabditis remanei]KAF1769931.1 hypothetical protein GCK72_001748 [Caenorhabditis remanei]
MRCQYTKLKKRSPRAEISSAPSNLLSFLMQEHLRWWPLFAFIAILCVSADAPPRFARSLAAYKTDKIETEPVSEVESAHPDDLYSEQYNVVRDVRRSNKNPNDDKKSTTKDTKGSVTINNKNNDVGSGTSNTTGASHIATGKTAAVESADPSNSSGGSPNSSRTVVSPNVTTKPSSTIISTTLEPPGKTDTKEALTTSSVVPSGQVSEKVAVGLRSSSSTVAEPPTTEPAEKNTSTSKITEASDGPTGSSSEITEAPNETTVIPDATTKTALIQSVPSTESTPNATISTSKEPDDIATTTVLVPSTQPPPVWKESSSVTPIGTTEKHEPTVADDHNREENPEEGISAALLSPASCQKLSPGYESCDEACKAAKDDEDSGNTLTGLMICAIVSLAIVFIAFCILSVFAIMLRRNKPSKPEIKPSEEKFEDPGAQRRAAEDAAVIKKDVEKKEEKSDEAAVQEDTPSLKNNPALERMRDKLKKTQDNLRLLRTHANKCAEEHKKDLANKFTPMGPIYIPKEPEVPPPADIPSSNISLTNVAWKDGLNELWEVGSDVDDIELDQDFVLNPDSVTEDETSQKSGKSKKSAKSKSKKSKKSQKSHKDEKDGDMRTPKLDATSVPSTSGTGPSTSGTGPSNSGTGPSTSGTGPSTSGLPSVSAPAPTAPTAEKPNASETKKDQNKSKEN